MQRRQFLRAAGGAGVAGAVAVPAAAQEESEGDHGGGGGGGTQEVAVGPDGAYTSFQPEEIAIQPGTTVRWVWESDGHNVVPEDQPEGSEWEGLQAISDTGTEHEHTFEVEGEYHYICEPHVGSGMEGWIEVSEDAGGGAGGGGPPTVPATALSVGIGLMAAMGSTLALAFLFLKYGGRSEPA